MPGLFDLIHSGLGQPDATTEAQRYLDQQAAANAGAVAGDPNAPFSGSYAKPPVAPAGPPMGAAQPGQGEPQSYQTPKSWGSILLDLQRQNQQEQQFDRSLGGMFATISQPRNREMVSHTFDTTPMDPLAFGKTAMDLSSQQQGQDRANQIARLVNGPQGQQIADKLHMDLGTLRTMIVTNPGAASKIAEALGTPSPDIATLTQLQHMGGGPGGGSPTLTDITSGVVSHVAGQDNAPMISAQAAWRTAHAGQPDTAMPWRPNDLADFKQWQANEASNEADRRTASSELVDKNEATLTLKGDLEELKDSPGLHSIMTTPGKRDVALKALNDGTVTDVPSMMARWGLSNDEAKAVALLRRIQGATTETAMKGMAGTGTRVTQAEVGPLKDAISMTQNLNQSYEDYVHGAINNAITKTKRAVAANYGSTGNVKNMDPEFAPWLNNTFQKGGQLWKEGSGADDLAPAQPVPASEIADGKELLVTKPYLRDEMLDNWQQRGFDTSKLRGKNPTKW